MNEEIRDRWVAALRSGEYKQGRSQLHSVRYGVSNFCCLGVLCDLAVRAGVGVGVVSEDASFTYDGELTTLPSSVMDWSGIEFEDGFLADNSTSLTEMNDDGVSFTEIADVIEQYF